MLRVPDEQIEYGDDGAYYFGGEYFTGIAFILFPNGLLESESSYSAGGLHGISSFYFESGTKQQESYYAYGTRHGSDKIWNESGALVEEANYEHGICTSKNTWSAAGEPQSTYTLEESAPGYELLLLRRMQAREQSDC